MKFLWLHAAGSILSRLYIDRMAPSSSSSADSVQPPRVVFKFGGTTVGNPGRFQTVIDLIGRAAAEGRVLCIVSALSRVTRRLSAAMEAFTTGEQPEQVVDELVGTLRQRHERQAEVVLGERQQKAYGSLLDERLRRLRHLFAQVDREGFSPAARDAVLAVGEQLSVPMVTLALREEGFEAPHCDATALVMTDETFGEANVQFDETLRRVRRWYRELSSQAVPVVAGFIGTTPDGQTTTLGFEGSDYSAALFAQILGAHCLTRYTDVDGLYTEDPNTNESAERLDCITMEEAYALTESNRLGMHPKTLRPLVEAGIPMQIRSIVEPGAPGTQIIPDGINRDAVPFSPEAEDSSENR